MDALFDDSFGVEVIQPNSCRKIRFVTSNSAQHGEVSGLSEITSDVHFISRSLNARPFNLLIDNGETLEGNINS